MLDLLPELLSAARKLHGDIRPCGYGTRYEKTWAQCVTVDDGIIRLWYNAPDNGTHIIAVAHRAAAEGEQP